MPTQNHADFQPIVCCNVPQINFLLEKNSRDSHIHFRLSYTVERPRTSKTHCSYPGMGLYIISYLTINSYVVRTEHKTVSLIIPIACNICKTF